MIDYWCSILKQRFADGVRAMEHGASARLEYNDFSDGDATPSNGHGKCEYYLTT